MADSPLKRPQPDSSNSKKKVEKLQLFDSSSVRVSHLLQNLSILNASDPVIDAAATPDVKKTEKVRNNETDPTRELKTLAISTVMSCTLCGIVFEERSEQTEHFRSDWHRYNIKQKLRGAKFITEADFMDQMDDLSSLSGSDTEDVSSLSEEEADDTILSPNRLPSSLRHTASSRFYFTSGEDVVAIYRAVVARKKQVIEDSSELLNLVKKAHKEDRWLIIMLSAGHFAAAVFKSGEVVEHKTFHRYVVRAKAGRAQSQHDKQDGKAASAGAQIRRYNETALAQEISELLESWKDHIKHCDRIFYRVPTHAYSYLFSKKEKYHLSRADPRVRTVPFATRRPTFHEVKRVFYELSSIRLLDPSCLQPAIAKPYSNAHQTSSHELKSFQEKTQGSRVDSPSRVRRQADPEQVKDLSSGDQSDPQELFYPDTEISFNLLPKPSDQNAKARRRRKAKRKDNDDEIGVEKENDHIEKVQEKPVVIPYISELYTACVSGNPEEFQNILSENKDEILSGTGKTNITEVLNCSIDSKRRTFLHLACVKCQLSMVIYLLNDGADPSLKDGSGLVPYLSTASKAIRNEFRFFRHDHPNKFDFTSAQIPPGISREQEAERHAKEHARKKEADKIRKAKQKKRDAELAVQKAEEEERLRFLRLSDREKRALAAEKRLLEQKQGTNVILSRCYQCAADITGKVPFEYLTYVFCSPACLKRHRLQPK